MAEEKINLSTQNQINEAEAPIVPSSIENSVDATPKKRGRKKKDKPLTPPVEASVIDENEGEFMNLPDSSPFNANVEGDMNEAEAVADVVVEEVTETVADEVVEEVTEAVADKVVEEVTETVADKVVEEVSETVAEEVAEEVTETVADVVVEEITEAVAENVAEEITEAVAEEVVEDEEGREEFILPTEFALPTEDENGFLYVEHFADLYDNAEDTGIGEALSEPIIEEELTLDEEREYENLTILSPVIEEEKPKPTRERRESLPDDEAYNPEKPRGVDNRFDIIELFVFTLVIIMLITTFFFKHSVVQGSSMESTLYEGDHLIISDFLYTPEQYDIVVVHDPEAHSEGPMVKRIIALEGQTVRLEKDLILEKSRPGKPYYILKVYVDNKPIRDDFVYYTGSDDIPIDYYFEDYKVIFKDYQNGEDIYEYVVPKGEVFVMGDHRDNSKDSREFGSIREETILGKVLIRIYPFDSFGKIEEKD